MIDYENAPSSAVVYGIKDRLSNPNNIITDVTTISQIYLKIDRNMNFENRFRDKLLKWLKNSSIDMKRRNTFYEHRMYLRVNREFTEAIKLMLNVIFSICLHSPIVIINTSFSQGF